MALLLGAFLLAACGTLQTDTADTTLDAVTLRLPDATLEPGDLGYDDPEMGTVACWVDYGQAEYGETRVFWPIATEPSASGFQLNYTPPATSGAWWS